MSSFETAFKSISGLVKDFKSNDKYYLSSNYSEADVRMDFINKFFIALGWDVRHETQKNPYEQEVRVEKPVQVAKAQKRADYTFYLAPNFRDVKFFVEAKKPYHDLEHKDYFFQTIRYGWNANTPIALLTDFEEFIILDCRYRPDIKDILNFKIKSFHYSEYTSEEKFREIYYLFSRESVLDNSIEKYADSLPKPKGKKLKATKTAAQSIDESFLEELDEIRTSLAKSFKKNNTHLTSDELTEATQRTIDRLVFIKFLEDKLIEPHHYVSEFGNKRTAWEDFITASISLDAKYNGVVFKKSLIDSQNIIETDDKTFSAICEELSHDNTPYNFDAIPIHILGSIYERFLGKVVNATDKRVTIEEKPEVRKAGGVYYTPQYIVNYIVDNTIGKLIESKTPKEISKLRFADIACGSGSFLITVYERILDYYKRWYINNPEQAKKDGCIFYEGAYRLSLQQKQRILTNNIYGVDLDSQAVEVTQLSLYLKLLEDETTATANDTWVLFKEQLLPDLNRNIVCGNSLIGTDILDSKLFDFKEEKKIKPMDFENVFPDVIKAGGFDAIVGNPPWGASISDIEKKYISNKYKSFKGNFDTYLFFVDRALGYLRQNGNFSYITPDSWIRVPQAENLRKIILDNFKILTITTLPQKVFKGVSANCIVCIIEKSKQSIKTTINIFHAESNLERISKLDFDDTYTVDQNIWSEDPEHQFQILLKGKVLDFVKKIREESNYGVEYLDVMQGIVPYSKESHSKEIISNRKFHSQSKLSNEYGKWIQGRCINRYTLNLEEFEFLKYGKWLHRPRQSKYFNQERILIQEITGGNPPRISATYCNEQLYHDPGIISCLNKSDIQIKILLGIINSTLISWYHRITSPKGSRKAFPKVLIGDIRNIPISKSILKLNKLTSSIEMLVDQLLSAKKQFQQAKTEGDKNYLERKCEALDNQIDKLVYELYGLTEEEIKIVEGK
jgi:type I restriction-modification system DNA methylase subunit